MSDVPAGTAPAPDPGQGGGPEGGSPAAPGQEHDLEWYKSQYEQLHPEFTRRSQALSEAEQRAQQYEDLFEALNDPEQAPDILKELGYDLGEAESKPEGQDPDEFEDPLEGKVAELEKVITQLQSEREEQAQSKEEEAALNARDEDIDQAITYIQGQEGVPELTEDEQAVLGNLAIAMVDEEGVPDVLGAYNRLYGEGGLLETNRKRWIDTKTGALTAPLGHGDTSEKRPTNRKERVAYIDARLRALDEQQ
jgi:DNA repair exonuclease SbcCD ATPase subunit